ncbi:MAG: hypothetical protein ABIK37_03825 [candidate division WOR-3 bacterium]
MRAIGTAAGIVLLLCLACSDAPLVVREANRVVVVELFTTSG